MPIHILLWHQHCPKHQKCSAQAYRSYPTPQGSAMQKFLYFAYTKILTIGAIITFIGFTLSAEYAFTKTGFILVFILY